MKPMTTVGIWFLLCLLFLVCAGALAQPMVAPAYPTPDQRYKADILLIVAHPDDETAVGSFLAKAVFDEHRRVAVLYYNRGEGGGNSVGSEQSTSLGAIREIEARRALAAFGITNVWFLNGRDTPTQDVFQSLQHWHHGEVLEATVRIVRLTRAEVILTWLPHVVSGENHADHQAAGIVATEAFDLAGDPSVFPAQVAPPRERMDINNWTEGLVPWQPKKIYYFSDASHPVEGPGPRFDLREISLERKVPYYRIAAELHAPHRTQGDVSEVAAKSLAEGDFTEFLKWLGKFNLIFGKAVVSCSESGDLFEGISLTPALYTRPPGYRAETHTGVSLELGGAFAFYRQFWHAHGIDHVGPLVRPEIAVASGSYFHLPLILRNNTNDSVEVVLSSKTPGGWKEVSGGAAYRLGPGDIYPVQTFMWAPGEALKDPQEISWLATYKGKVCGTATIKVTVTEWALPE